MSLNKEIRLDDIIDIIIEKLESGGTVIFTPNGTSMLPMLRDGQDAVVLRKKTSKRLQLFDVVLYKRDNGTYVLHRVVDFGCDDTYVMCGDNQFNVERGIRDDQIIAILTEFYRKGKVYSVNSLRYYLYVHFWYYTRFFRKVYSFGKNKTKKLFASNEKTKSNEQWESENSDKQN